MQLTIDNVDGIYGAGVTEIIDKDDLRNGRLPKIAADATFYDIIEWLKDEVPRIDNHSFFTIVGVGYTGETMVVFSGQNSGGSATNIMIDASAIRYAAPGTDKSPRETYEGSAAARCALEVAFNNAATPRKLYQGLDAGAKPNPVGKVRPDWGSGPMYEFAPGANEADYPETQGVSNQPLYRFFVDGEWLVFARTKKGVRGSGPFGSGAKVVPAWRLQGR